VKERLRTLEDVVEALRHAKDRDKKCSLLIGAGCSETAGIPTASGFVKEIERRYPCAYTHAKQKTYPACMSALPPGDRRDLIASYVDKAKINWAHLGIAQLMKGGFIDRVLTTNFDPLVVRSCAMAGFFPAVYDSAASKLFRPEDIFDQAIFHLHGQRAGFVLMNTEAECSKHKESLAPVFTDAGSGRVWLVVGYSGANDPVFDLLANTEVFHRGLYWVVNGEDTEPESHVIERLLKPEGKCAFYVRTTGADEFFVSLTQKLDCFPPQVIGDPLGRVKEDLDRILPYKLPGSSSETDIVEETRNDVLQLRKQQQRQKKRAEAISLLLKGDYEAVASLLRDASDAESYDLRAWAFIGQGNSLLQQARLKGGTTAGNKLFMKAGAKYAKAIRIKSDMHDAFYNWGTTLLEQAKLKGGTPESDQLFAEAGEKFAEAVRIKPDMHEAFNNWGSTLLEQAKLKGGTPESDQLFAEAGEKFAEAIRIKPDMHEVLFNWGTALSEQAKLKEGTPESDQLFAEADKKFAEAVRIKPEKHEAFNNWGIALSEQAKLKAGTPESDQLFAEAGTKFAAAVRIKPEKHEAFNNWGIALLEQAKLKGMSSEGERLFTEAGTKFNEAIRIKPDMDGAYFNLACLHSLCARVKECCEALELWKKFNLNAKKLKLDADSDFDAVRTAPDFMAFRMSLPE
jgi:tetratricopeptide (TPR) repeat protein